MTRPPVQSEKTILSKKRSSPVASLRLLEGGDEAVGLDNLNDYLAAADRGGLGSNSEAKSWRSRPTALFTRAGELVNQT